MEGWVHQVHGFINSVTYNDRGLPRSAYKPCPLVPPCPQRSRLRVSDSFRTPEIGTRRRAGQWQAGRSRPPASQSLAKRTGSGEASAVSSSVNKERARETPECLRSEYVILFTNHSSANFTDQIIPLLSYPY